MKDKRVSPKEYEITLYIVGIVVIIIMAGLFIWGSVAATKVLGLPDWAALPIFLTVMLIWTRYPRKSK